MHYVIGTNLQPSTKQDVLSTFGYRWTVENEARAKDWHHVKRGPFINETDVEWLARYSFAVKTDGTLDRRHGSAYPASFAAEEV